MNLLNNLKIIPLILTLTTSTSSPTGGLVKIRKNESEYLEANSIKLKPLVEDTELYMISLRIRHKGGELTGKQLANDIKFMEKGGVTHFFAIPQNAIVIKELFDGWDATATLDRVDAEIDDAVEAELINVPNSLKLISVRDLIKLQYLWKVLGHQIVEELLSLKLTLFMENGKYLEQEWITEAADESKWKRRSFNHRLESQWIQKRFAKAMLRGRKKETADDLKTSSRQFLEMNAEALTSLFHSLDEMETKEDVDRAISSAVANQLHSLPNYWLLSNVDLIKTLYLHSRHDQNSHTALRRIRWRWGPLAILKYLNLRSINRQRIYSIWMPKQIERTWMINFYSNISFPLIIVCYIVNYFEMSYLLNLFLKRLYNALWSTWLM